MYDLFLNQFLNFHKLLRQEKKNIKLDSYNINIILLNLI